MRVCIVGGGAAGMVASIFLAQGGVDVILLEKCEKLGKKMFITGKGRCNVTNDCELQDFFAKIVRGEKFLRSSLYGFTPQDAMEFFESLGLPLVTERGNRVFPLSQKSSDVIRALEKRMRALGVGVRLNCEVMSIKQVDNGFEIATSYDSVISDKVIIATGGLSYPSTGSTGDGYKFAKNFGHSIVDTVQGLCAIHTKQNVSSLEGLSLKNVQLTSYDENGRVIMSEFGEMLFTRNGISGPIAITTSSYINRKKNVSFTLDLKPAIDDKTLDNRLLREFDERKNQDIKNVLRALLPERLNTYVLKYAKIDENKKVNSITREERARLVNIVKNLPFDMSELASFLEAIITSGGVDIKELKPTCESKKVSGVYFVGETIDVDALTGGFNLQIAYSTAVNAARDILKND